MIDDKLVAEVIGTRKVKHNKRKTIQSIRDHEKIVKRMDNAGVKFDFVAAYFEKIIGPRYTVSSMLEIASNLANNMHLKIDRLAKRNRSALLCWFAEHWVLLSPHLLLADNGSCPSINHSFNDGIGPKKIEEKVSNNVDNSLEFLDVYRLLN